MIKIKGSRRINKKVRKDTIYTSMHLERTSMHLERTDMHLERTNMHLERTNMLCSKAFMSRSNHITLKNITKHSSPENIQASYPEKVLLLIHASLVLENHVILWGKSNTSSQNVFQHCTLL